MSCTFAHISGAPPWPDKVRKAWGKRQDSKWRRSNASNGGGGSKPHAALSLAVAKCSVSWQYALDLSKQFLEDSAEFPLAPHVPKAEACHNNISVSWLFKEALSLIVFHNTLQPIQRARQYNQRQWHAKNNNKRPSSFVLVLES